MGTSVCDKITFKRLCELRKKESNVETIGIINGIEKYKTSVKANSALYSLIEIRDDRVDNFRIHIFTDPRKHPVFVIGHGVYVRKLKVEKFGGQYDGHIFNPEDIDVYDFQDDGSLSLVHPLGVEGDHKYRKVLRKLWQFAKSIKEREQRNKNSQKALEKLCDLNEEREFVQTIGIINSIFKFKTKTKSNTMCSIINIHDDTVQNFQVGVFTDLGEHPTFCVGQFVRLRKMKVEKIGDEFNGTISSANDIDVYDIEDDGSISLVHNLKTLIEGDDDIRELWRIAVGPLVSLKDIQESGHYSIRCQILSINLSTLSLTVTDGTKNLLYDSKSHVEILLKNLTSDFEELHEGQAVIFSPVVANKIELQNGCVLSISIDCMKSKIYKMDFIEAEFFKLNVYHHLNPEQEMLRHFPDNLQKAFDLPSFLSFEECENDCKSNHEWKGFEVFSRRLNTGQLVSQEVVKEKKYDSS